MALSPWAPVAVSVALRLAYLLQIRSNPFFDVPVMDEGYHDLWARELAAGDWGSRLPFFRAPLYPFLLSLAYRLPEGPDFLLIRGLQLLFGAVTPFLVWHLARRLFPERRWMASAAAYVTALDGMLAYFEAELLLESLLAPFSVGLLLLVLGAGETGRARRWLAAGLMLGLFAVTRPNVLLFAPVLFVIATAWQGTTFRWRALRWRGALALTAGTCALVLPVTAANLLGGHDRVLVASQGGLNFFLGNNPEADGWSATAPSTFRLDWWGGYEDAVRLAEEAEGRALRPSEVSRFWYGRGLDWLREDPVRGAAHLAHKLTLLLSRAEFGNNRDIHAFFREFAPMGLPFLWLLAVMTPLAVAGSVSLARRGGPAGATVLIYLGVYSLTIVLFFVTARYRVPLRPVLAVLAVGGARALALELRARPARGSLAAAAVILFAVGVNVNPWLDAYKPAPAIFYQAVAGAQREHGDLAGAVEWLTRAAAADPHLREVHFNLGLMQMEKGEVPAAIAAFQRERALDPGNERNLGALAEALERAGQVEEAERAYSAAEAAGLEYGPALYRHALCLERLERAPEELESMYRRVLDADPSHADAWNNLGVALARQERLEEAVVVWQRGLEASPGHSGMLSNLQRAEDLD
jgi:cytochrome c-type biogenesis protein CcmH/NrfG